MSKSESHLVPVPTQIDQHSAHRLLSDLSAIWAITTGATPADLDSDLETLKRWFDPVAQGQRLRREVADLPSIPVGVEDPGPPWTIEVSSGKVLVTPEGRCLLDLLGRFPLARDVWSIDEDDVARFDAILGGLYRSWSRHRLESVVALLAGTTKPLQIPAAGVVIALLVEGCISEKHALVRHASSPGKEVIDRAFFRAASAFADVLAPSRRGKRDSRLISGWMLHEVRRRVGDSLVLEDFKGEGNGRVWITKSGVDHVVEVVARDLARGHRARATPELFAEGFDALVRALIDESPNLAAFGIANERPAETRKLRARFVELLSQATPESESE